MSFLLVLVVIILIYIFLSIWAALLSIWILYFISLTTFEISLLFTILLTLYEIKIRYYSKDQNRNSTSLTQVKNSVNTNTFSIKASFYEYRKENVRVYAGTRKGVAASRNISKNRIKKIDKGMLVLTNDSLVFDGNRFNKVMKFNKIISIKVKRFLFSSNKLAVSLENRQKTMYYRIDNPDFYKNKIEEILYV